MFLKSQPHENQLREVVTKAKIGKLVATKGIHESHVKKGKPTYINPFICHFPLMLWNEDFVAKGEKGDCVALQEEGTSVYTRFNRLQASELLEAVLLCFGQWFSS